MSLLVPCCDVRYDLSIDTMFGSSLPQLFVGGLIFYIRYLCLLFPSMLDNLSGHSVTQ